MHKTILIEEITIENVTEKINEKVQEMEKETVIRLKLCPFGEQIKLC